MLGEPLANLESRPSIELFVELDSDPRLERLEAPGEPAGDAQDAVEQLAVDDLRKVEVDVDPTAGLGWENFGPSLVAARANVEVHLVAWQWSARALKLSRPRS
jgi:hypothetical protein